jgi:hypothetical protein
MLVSQRTSGYAYNTVEVFSFAVALLVGRPQQ